MILLLTFIAYCGGVVIGIIWLYMLWAIFVSSFPEVEDFVIAVRRKAFRDQHGVKR